MPDFKSIQDAFIDSTGADSKTYKKKKSPLLKEVYSDEEDEDKEKSYFKKVKKLLGR